MDVELKKAMYVSTLKDAKRGVLWLLGALTAYLYIYSGDWGGVFHVNENGGPMFLRDLGIIVMALWGLHGIGTYLLMITMAPKENLPPYKEN